MVTDELIKRLDDRLKELNLSDAEAGRVTTGRAEAVRNIRRGRMPGAIRFEMIARGLGLNPEWLLSGVGPKLLTETATRNPATTTPQITDLIERSTEEVLIALVASGVIPSIDIPARKAAQLVAGAWARRNKNPDAAKNEIAAYLASELELMLPQGHNVQSRVLTALESTDAPQFGTSVSKLN